MNNKKIRYIICIVVLVITLFLGGFLVIDNSKEKNNKKELEKVNKYVERKKDVLSQIEKLKKELKKDSDDKDIYKEIDKLNEENANLDLSLDELEQKKVINYKGLVSGIIIIIMGLGTSTYIFIKTKNNSD